MWGVSDSAGRSEGLGSRFFTVLNAAGDAPLSAADAQTAIERLRAAPGISRGDARALDEIPTAFDGVWGRTGPDLASAFEVVPVDTAAYGTLRFRFTTSTAMAVSQYCSRRVWVGFRASLLPGRLRARQRDCPRRPRPVQQPMRHDGAAFRPAARASFADGSPA